MYFGKLVSTELLLAFSQVYTENMENVNNPNSFSDFSSKLPDILVSCLGCALNERKFGVLFATILKVTGFQVTATSFVDNAILYYGDRILANTFSDDNYYFVTLCRELVGVANGLGMVTNDFVFTFIEMTPIQFPIVMIRFKI